MSDHQVNMGEHYRLLGYSRTTYIVDNNYEKPCSEESKSIQHKCIGKPTSWIDACHFRSDDKWLKVNGRFNPCWGSIGFCREKKWKLAFQQETKQFTTNNHRSLNEQTERFRNRNVSFDTIGDKQLKSDKQTVSLSREHMVCSSIIKSGKRQDEETLAQSNKLWRLMGGREYKYNCCRNRVIILSNIRIAVYCCPPIWPEFLFRWRRANGRRGDC